MNLWALKLDRKWLLLGKLRIIRLFHILFWWQFFDFCFLSFLVFRYSSVILSNIYLRKTPTTLKTLLKYRTNSFCNFKSHISEFFVIQSLKDEIKTTERWDNNINEDISSIYHQGHFFATRNSCMKWLGYSPKIIRLKASSKIIENCLFWTR